MSLRWFLFAAEVFQSHHGSILYSCTSFKSLVEWGRGQRQFQNAMRRVCGLVIYINGDINSVFCVLILTVCYVNGDKKIYQQDNSHNLVKKLFKYIFLTDKLVNLTLGF